MAAYSGKVVDWEAALQSNFSLAPDIRSMQDAAPILPDGSGLYPIAAAGRTVAF
jgi:hypothetical protein